VSAFGSINIHNQPIDFQLLPCSLSADCEGCETLALSGLDLDKVSVSVLLIEHPSCEVAEKFMSHGYIAVPLWASYDFVFLSPRSVHHIPSPGPDLTTQKNAKKSVAESKALKFRGSCPGLVSHMWEMGQAWPPAISSSSRLLS
jgi:hypothetical protein